MVFSRGNGARGSSFPPFYAGSPLGPRPRRAGPPRPPLPTSTFICRAMRREPRVSPSRIDRRMTSDTLDVPSDPGIPLQVQVPTLSSVGGDSSAEPTSDGEFVRAVLKYNNEDGR